MDYEKKYKESMAKMFTFLAKHDGFTISKDGEMYKELSDIFPELKESEDEKIRKAILELVRQSSEVLDKQNQNKMLAWLEKQSDNLVKNSYTNNKDYIRYADRYSYEIWRKLMDNFKNIKDYHIGCNEVSDIVLNAIIDTFNWLEKGGDKNKVSKHVEAINEEKVDDANKVEPKDYSSIDPHFFKTTDKVETKFKVGDFIVNDYCSGKVVKITDDAYLLDTGQGIPFSCEHNVHLWNVTKDAKDGDVLCCESGWTCIFKTLNSDNISFSSYCFMDNTGWFCETGSESHTLEKAFIKAYNGEIYPATKEQRDLLFAKMKEAGYDWDTEKKELKKIELKSDGEVEHLIPQKGIYYTCIKDYYSSDNTHLCVKGNIYKSSFNGYIDDELHFGLSWTNSCAEKYFEPTKDEDWVVCEYDNVIGKPLQYKEFKKKVNQKFIENLKAQSLTPKLRLWNLQDAKAGDVLAISWWEDNNFWEKIIIFKKYHNKGVKGLYYMPCVEGYGNTFKNGKLVFNEKVLYYSKTWTCNLHPATKEQRDTLERAMTDAGYTFNFESKELRKSEKPIEWSYEDEANLNNIIWLCNNCIKGTETTWIPSQATKIKHLIETIKEEGLAQQNPAWSEEDEQIILSIEQAMNCASLLNIAPEKMDKIRAWLKSLKDRCTWKPSSLQMECLHDAIKHYHTNGYPASKLKELYEQMSKIYKL